MNLGFRCCVFNDRLRHINKFNTKTLACKLQILVMRALHLLYFFLLTGKLLSAQNSQNELPLAVTKNQEKALLEICWLGEGPAQVLIGRTGIMLQTRHCTKMKVQPGQSYSVSVEQAGKRYKSASGIMVDSGGAVLCLSLDANKNKQVLTSQIFSNRHEQQLYESKRIALRDSIVKRITAQMVYITGGTFKMGCMEGLDPTCATWEKPAHPVTLKSFYLAKFEVSQAEWEAVMNSKPFYWSDCPQCPVEQVSWLDAQRFVQKLNTITSNRFRLPTEAEWEFAARGGNAGSQFLYSGSNTLEEVGWFGANAGNSGNRTQPVGLKQPNTLGLYDMSGNVAEWCSDWFVHTYYNQRVVKQPTGPVEGQSRVLRGGCYGYYAVSCRVTCRYGDSPDRRFRRYGFRLAMETVE